jgi:hypothetical protein
MHIKPALFLMLTMILCLAACAPAAPQATLSPSLPPPQLSTPTAQLAPEDTPPLETIPPAPTESQTPADPLAGLVFQTPEGLWMVGHDGQPRKLVDDQRAAVSPDGRFVAYAAGDPSDLWLLDLSTGERRNLTDTPDRYEMSPQFWKAQPDLLVFESKPTSQELFGSGFPTLVHLDGSGYQVLDTTRGGPISLSPDGQNLAFGCCDAPGVIYNLSSGAAPFYPQEYGVQADKLFMPAYSPDGTQLAWHVGGQDLVPGGSYQNGVALFDLNSQQGRLLFNTTAGGGEYPEYLRWGPGGAWLAYVAYGTEMFGRRPALYALEPQADQAILVGEGFNPVWNVDGSQLAYSTQGQDAGDQKMWLVAPGNWKQPQLVPFPGLVVDWVNP